MIYNTISQLYKLWFLVKEGNMVTHPTDLSKIKM